MMGLKNFKILLLSLILVIVGSITCFADYDYDYLDYKDSKYMEDINGHIAGVWDLADLLTTTEEEDLFETAKEAAEYLDTSVIYLTYDDAKTRSTMEYTDDFFDYVLYENGTVYAKGETKKYGLDSSGLLFAIDMDNRMSYLNLSGDTIEFISDGDVDKSLSKGDANLKNADYYDALKNISQKAFEYVESGKHSQYGQASLVSGSKYKESFGRRILSTFKRFTLLNVLFILGVGILVGVLSGFGLKKLDDKANKAISAKAYVKAMDLNIVKNTKSFIRSYTTISHGYYSSSSSSGGGGGHSSHSSGGGHSHGGGGHSF